VNYNGSRLFLDRLYTLLFCADNRTHGVPELSSYYNNHHQVLRVSLPCALESITVNAMQDMCFVGATNGCIYAIDLSVTAIAISAANASVGYVNSKRGGERKNVRVR
jgi:hypothetical protein